jgi:imidazolonepropionase-like amidohydrolase
MQLLKGARIVDGTGAGPIHDGAILIEGERIKAVGRAEEFGADPELETLDLGHLTLAPGFVDTHMHLTGSGKESAPDELRQDSDEVLLLRCATNAQTAIREGVTTFRDCGARNRVIFTFRDAARRKIVPSPRLLAAGGAITLTGGYAWFFGVEADDPAELRRAIRNQVKLGADFIKVMVTSGIHFGPAIAVLHYDAHTMCMAVEEAASLGRFIAAHCLSTDGIRASVAAGVRTIEHCAFFDPARREAHYDPELGQAIARKNIYVNTSHAWCYASSAAAGEGAGPAESRLALMGRMHAGFVSTSRSLLQAGVRLIPGSDAGWFGQPFGEYGLMPKVFVEEIGMRPKDAFEACTRIAAEAIGLGQEIGTLEPGKRADVIGLEGDPTSDIDAMQRVRMTMLDGAIVFPPDTIHGRKTSSARSTIAS